MSILDLYAHKRNAMVRQLGVKQVRELENQDPWPGAMLRVNGEQFEVVHGGLWDDLLIAPTDDSDTHYQLWAVDADSSVVVRAFVTPEGISYSDTESFTVDHAALGLDLTHAETRTYAEYLSVTPQGYFL